MHKADIVAEASLDVMSKEIRTINVDLDIESSKQDKYYFFVSEIDLNRDRSRKKSVWIGAERFSIHQNLSR